MQKKRMFPKSTKLKNNDISKIILLIIICIKILMEITKIIPKYYTKLYIIIGRIICYLYTF